MALFDEEEKERINPFDWNSKSTGFGQILDEGGFDVIIGNPPYVRQESLSEIVKTYFKSKYEVYKSSADLYVYFIEKSHRLLKRNGLFGFICSNKFMRTNYGGSLRDFIKKYISIQSIIDFGELPVFHQTGTFPLIIFTKNIPAKLQRFIYAPLKRLDFKSLDNDVKEIGKNLDSRSIEGENWSLASIEEINIFEKMKSYSKPLGEYVNKKIYRGILTGLNKAFVINNDTRKRIVERNPIEKELIKPFVRGNDIRKYHIFFKNEYLITIPSGWTELFSSGFSNKWEWFKKKFPNIAEHLSQYSVEAKKRCDQGQYWWELRPCVYYEEFSKPKIIFPDIAKESRMAFDHSGIYVGNTAYVIPKNDFYLLGILNSKLIFCYFKRHATVLGDPDKGGRLRWIYQDVIKIPIRIIDFNKSKDEDVSNKIIDHVKKIIHLNEEKAILPTSFQKDKIDQEIKNIDENIDELVYELYGITKEEIKIIEEGT